MNFIQRAIKNVTRKLSKSILLVITFFVIGNFVIIGLGVASAAEDAKILTRQKMRAVVTYSIDYNEVWKYVDSLTDEDEVNEFYKNYPSIKLDDVKELLADSRVATANAFMTSQAYKTEDYDYVHLNNQAEENMDNMGEQCWLDENGNQQCEMNVEPTHFVKANMFPNMIEFVDGGYTIVEGRFYDQKEIDNAEPVILVSKAFADLNGLRVGDTYSVFLSYPSELDRIGKNIGITIEDLKSGFEIVGIFDHNSKITPDMSNFDWTYPYENPDNMLLAPATSVFMARLPYEQALFDYYASMWPDDEYYSEENRPSMELFEQNSVNDVTFLLNDPLEVDQFVEDHKVNLAQFMKLDANNEEFNRLSKPLDTIGLYANFIIWLVVINAIIIISLVTALTLKTREYEIGVLLSIGASKLKIIAQFFIELAIVAVIGFTLAVGSGSLVANKVGQKVLEFQIQESDVNNDEEYYYTEYNSIWDNDYSTEITLEDLISEYNVSVSPLIIGEIYVMGLGIVLISILIPSMMIMRFNPKKILMNQN